MEYRVFPVISLSLTIQPKGAKGLIETPKIKYFSCCNRYSGYGKKRA